jgi:hypothetical protein
VNYRKSIFFSPLQTCGFPVLSSYTFCDVVSFQKSRSESHSHLSINQEDLYLSEVFSDKSDNAMFGLIKKSILLIGAKFFSSKTSAIIFSDVVLILIIGFKIRWSNFGTKFYLSYDLLVFPRVDSHVQSLHFDQN